jgi:hypothetical protein
VALELAAGEHGATPHRTEILGRLHGRQAQDPLEARAAWTRPSRSRDSQLDRPRLPQHCQRQASEDAWARMEPPTTRTPARTGSGHNHQRRTPAQAGRPPGRTSQTGSAATRPRMPRVPGSTFGAQALRVTPEPRRPRWPATRGHGTQQDKATPDRHGPKKRKRYPTQPTAADPQPTPARHCRVRRTTRCKDSPSGRTPGPPNRAAPHRHGPKGKQYPTQSTAEELQPTTARHCRARRITRCKDSPAGRSPVLRRVPVTLHRSCTPELGTSCDVAVHSNIATRTAPDPLCRQETRIRHPRAHSTRFR